MKSFLRLKLKGRNFMGIGIMKSCQDKFGNLLSCNALLMLSKTDIKFSSIIGFLGFKTKLILDTKF